MTLGNIELLSQGGEYSPTSKCPDKWRYKGPENGTCAVLIGNVYCSTNSRKKNADSQSRARSPRETSKYREADSYCPTENRVSEINHIGYSPLRNVDREGWRPGVVNPASNDLRQGSRRDNRRLPLSKCQQRNEKNDCVCNRRHIDCDPDHYPVGHKMPFPVYGAANQKRLRYRGLLGDLPLLQAYRRGARYHGFLAPQPFVKGAVPAYPESGIYFCRSKGPAREWIPQLNVAFKPFRNHSRPYRLMVRTPLFHGGNPGSMPGRVTHSKTVRFTHPFHRTGRRFSVPACLRQTHYYYHRYLRNVSHLNLLPGGAPTPSPVTIMAGRFFRCRNSLSDFRKSFSETEI